MSTSATSSPSAPLPVPPVADLATDGAPEAVRPTPAAASNATGRHPAARRAPIALRTAHWPLYAGVGLLLLYALVFLRGLSWEWRGILTATAASPPVLASAPRSVPAAAPRSAVPAAAQPAAAQPGQAATGPRQPLPPTDEPPPRNAIDKYGVSYDENGVAVMGIDADPSGVYNVPAGRQLRIGGPQGALFDVEPGGKLKPATSITVQPK